MLSNEDKIRMMFLVGSMISESALITNDLIERRERLESKLFINSVKLRLESLTEEDIEKMATL